jgi:hypothetical protein
MIAVAIVICGLHRQKGGPPLVSETTTEQSRMQCNEAFVGIIMEYLI